jgi:hypothetical protein
MMSQERGPGLPPPSFPRFRIEGETTAPLPSSGARVRDLLIKAGLLVPVEVVAVRPVGDPWIESPTCRMLGTEDHRIPDRRHPAP